MASDIAQILAAVPNSGIVQMPGRRFPGVVVQGDSLSSMFDDLVSALSGAKNSRDEESYYGIYMVVERMQELLASYEDLLEMTGKELPYSVSIRQRLVRDDFDV